MKTVSLRSVTLDRFRSFRSKVTVDLSGNPGMVLVAGDNRAEPSLGANGSGKSSLFDAVCFALYGTSVKGLRVADLVTFGEKKTEVSVSVDVDGTAHTVTRSGPPARILLDGDQVEQLAVDRLLGLSRERFLNSVIFGQAVPLFIDRSIPERGELLDEVLDLKLWMKASDLAGKQWTVANGQLDALKVEVGRTEGAMSSIEDTATVRDEIERWDAQRQERATELNGRIAALTAELDKATLDRDGLALSGPPDADGPRGLLDAARSRETRIRSDLAVAKRDVERVTDDIAFLRDNAVCPSCEQEIDRAEADVHIATHQVELDGLNAKAESLGFALVAVYRALTSRQSAYDEANAARSDYRVSMAKADGLVESKQREVLSAQRALEQVDSQENPHKGRLEDLKRRKMELRVKLRDQRKEEARLVSLLTNLDYWRQGFRKVRLFCMGRALAQLELDTMNAAASLGLAGWRISYSTESETKSGTVKTGVQVAVKSPTVTAAFSAWSGGEGQRIRLCTALGLGGLIQRWSGVRWDVEVFDEPSAWLSESGIEDLLELLKARADEYGRRVYVCDHRGLQHAGIDRVVTVAKGANGSYIV